MRQVNAEIGQRIRKYRKAAGYTQEQVAVYSGVASEYISRIELGKENPTIGILVKICQALSIDIAQLFCKEE